MEMLIKYKNILITVTPDLIKTVMPVLSEL